MVKLYYRALFMFILFAFLVNMFSFASDFDKRQLTNPFFYKNRAVALYYLAKNITLETGIYITYSKLYDIENAIYKASAEYGVSYGELSSVIKPNMEYSIWQTGGMGLSGITPEQFSQTPFKDPYNLQDNINAAAFTMNALKSEGLSEDELAAAFVLSGVSPAKMAVMSPATYELYNKLSDGR